MGCLLDEATVDTVVLGASSYAVYNNGEVWCTELVVQRGQAVAVGMAAGMSFTILFRMIGGFLIVFVITTVAALLFQEIRRRPRELSQD
ncbi:MAG: hypothetical protein L0332_30110 [Chloroflexi bacterium]|nr:hypothetical protein [Chloroflexota bacterium]MCI0576964.1 hypothetical protein [Chloroflexota bacterium]MCI0645562.1 hypothetical protein [Chloroflexota bacterium]MCI0730957.1 hypothetical protein [Chloroflexota bacterium]